MLLNINYNKIKVILFNDFCYKINIYYFINVIFLILFSIN